MRTLLTLLLLAPALAAPAASPLAGRKPNIVFVITDDQGYGDLSCHGNPVLKTPNIDALHAASARFTDFLVSPTCAPTRSALMTGRHEFANGVTHTILERERLALDAVTLPQLLKTAGYATGIFGKWHLGDQPEYQPNRRGFDEVFIHGAGGIGQSYEGSCGDAPGNTYFDPVLLHNGTFEKTRGYCTDVFFRQAMDWIASRKDKGPFYCHLATNAPHGPLQVRPEDEARYAGQVPPDAAKFFGMIANIDDNVGRLLARLKELGLEKDTLVVFMTDNGGTAGVKVFNAGMRGSKGSPWMGGIRVPSFWRWPGVIPPGDVTATAAHLDFLPTLAELAGVELTGPARDQVVGRSLAPLLLDPRAPWPDRALFTHLGRWPRGADPADSQFANCSVREGRWHLVREERRGKGKGKSAPAEESAWALFDLTADPGEQTDVSAAHPEVVKRLDAAYRAWWDSVRPRMVNENAVFAPENTFKTLFREQFPTGAK